MAKILKADIKELGFTYQMYNKENDRELDTMLDLVIAEQALLLAGRVGSTPYASVTSPTVDYVKRAELCLCAAEMIQRRINNQLANVQGNGQEIDISHEGTQKKVYMNEANKLIAKIVGGGTTDNLSIASGVLESDHFTLETS